ncbi:MAG: PAS domain S-box protein [Deltaproteobacteria bacterium]|uniref:PAS domain S-box protein n=1 Tax=Candidatus Zymogenus saltonus TaxID=2844893 RepID=A0A9D8KD53_9DELT|nr:PAS domain S-box protein [Candidatus Zymogenus saltonus]
MNEDKFFDLFENAPNAYFSFGADSIIRVCNRRAEELTGYARDEMMGRSIFDFYADTIEGKAKAVKVFNEILRGGGFGDVELMMQRSDKTHIWVNISLNAILNENGKPSEFRSMVVDITDRKRVEEEQDIFIRELMGIFSKVGELVGLLPICSHCKKIRDDNGDWKRIEEYFGQHFGMEFTHAFCPDCIGKFQSEDIKNCK